LPPYYARRPETSPWGNEVPYGDEGGLGAEADLGVLMQYVLPNRGPTGQRNSDSSDIFWRERPREDLFMACCDISKFTWCSATFVGL